MQDFIVDRRPVAAISHYGALYDQTPTGQSKVFYEPGGVAWSIENWMQPMRDIGYKRFMIWLPAGSNWQRFMASAQWGPLPDYRKIEYEEILMPWARENDVEIGIYMGFQIHDPYSLKMPEDLIRTPDLSKAEDREWFHVNTGNWNRLGCHWIIGDAASHTQHREAALKLSQFFYANGMKYTGEALPIDRDPVTGEINFTSGYENKMSWCCLYRYAARRDPHLKWKFDPKTSEMILLFSGHTEQAGFAVETKEDLRKRAEQGFVLGCMRTHKWDTAKWTYDIAMEFMEKSGPRLPIPTTAYRPFKSNIADGSTQRKTSVRKGFLGDSRNSV